MAKRDGAIWVIEERGHRAHPWKWCPGEYPASWRAALDLQLRSQRLAYPSWFFRAHKYVPAPERKKGRKR
jgi:hypothetical protein